MACVRCLGNLSTFRVIFEFHQSVYYEPKPSFLPGKEHSGLKEHSDGTEPKIMENQKLYDPLCFQQKIHEFVEELSFTRKQYKNCQIEVQTLTARCHELERTLEKERAACQTNDAGLKAALIDAQNSRSDALARLAEEAQRLRLQMSVIEQELKISREQARQLQADLRSRQRRLDDCEQQLSRQTKQINTLMDAVKQKEEERCRIQSEVESLSVAHNELRKYVATTETLAKESQQMALQAGDLLREMKGKYEAMQKEVVQERGKRQPTRETSASTNSKTNDLLQEKISKLEQECESLRTELVDENQELLNMAKDLAESSRIILNSDAELVKLNEIIKEEQRKQEDLRMTLAASEAEMETLKQVLEEKSKAIRSFEDQMTSLARAKLNCRTVSAQTITLEGLTTGYYHHDSHTRIPQISSKKQLLMSSTHQDALVLCSSSPIESPSEPEESFVPDSQDVIAVGAGYADEVVPAKRQRLAREVSNRGLAEDQDIFVDTESVLSPKRSTIISEVTEIDQFSKQKESEKDADVKKEVNSPVVDHAENRNEDLPESLTRKPKRQKMGYNLERNSSDQLVLPSTQEMIANLTENKDKQEDMQNETADDLAVLPIQKDGPYGRAITTELTKNGNMQSNEEQHAESQRRCINDNFEENGGGEDLIKMSGAQEHWQVPLRDIRPDGSQSSEQVSTDLEVLVRICDNQESMNQRVEKETGINEEKVNDPVTADQIHGHDAGTTALEDYVLSSIPDRSDGAEILDGHLDDILAPEGSIVDKKADIVNATNDLVDMPEETEDDEKIAGLQDLLTKPICMPMKFIPPIRKGISYGKDRTVGHFPISDEFAVQTNSCGSVVAAHQPVFELETTAVIGAGGDVLGTGPAGTSDNGPSAEKAHALPFVTHGVIGPKTADSPAPKQEIATELKSPPTFMISDFFRRIFSKLPADTQKRLLARKSVIPEQPPPAVSFADMTDPGNSESKPVIPPCHAESSERRGDDLDATQPFMPGAEGGLKDDDGLYF